MAKVKAAVFASGSGSNFEAIMKAGELPCEITLLVCDKPGAGAVERAKRLGVPVLELSPKQFKDKAAYEQALVKRLREEGIEWIFLAGYMRLIGPDLLGAYENRILNIHPSLLPDFPGADGIGDAFRAGVNKTGVTIHYVDAGMDTGPIIKQREVDILPNDTIDTLAERIHKVEHELYPEVIREVLTHK
ncbi:phosphoribosylglycinamide formyltransferase [Aciduricibacillus chroicocephali]|uniref:Phosphoribosylglycinamide formyltransferase n=1 Tax=Aciduricibacillus chroicocephali TaxID=3054939 RepID=A0ABY9KWN3_9BACI|nr:phosphoribosylglycinamide formyltransferase [Bacillaceae bacterium 44XB]